MCGLFGFIGKEKTPIHYSQLIQLGVDNDVRGGDACGIVIDDKVEYGIDKLKYFETFYKESKLLRNTKEARFILGHTRKASVGQKTIKEAQPVVIYNQEGDIDFVLIHNGTIENYKDLAKKYLTDFDESWTDSQVMARIFYYNNYNVLKEYIGAGVFITADYRQNKDRIPVIHMFKGCSKIYKGYGELTEERPLCYITTNEGIWFSSRSEVFYEWLYQYDKKPFNLPSNKLLLVENNKLYEIESIDRTKLYQKEFNNVYYGGYYGGYNKKDYENAAYGYSDFWKSLSKQDEVDAVMHPKTNDNAQLKINFDKNQNNDNCDYIELRGDRYYWGDELANGSYKLDIYGKIRSEKSSYPTYYFLDGVIVYGETVFNTLCSLMEEFYCDPGEFFSIIGNDLSAFCLMPVYDETKKLYVDINGNVIKSYSFTPLFQKKGNIHEYYIKNGALNIKNKVQNEYKDLKMSYRYKTRSSLFDIYDEQLIIDYLFREKDKSNE